MAITITLPDKQIEEIRKRVAVHESASVSGVVQRAVQRMRRAAGKPKRGKAA